jgi:SNF2 family DNA or RNA helicase
MNESNLHGYQKFAVDAIINNPACGLFLDMGLGKTVSTLTAIDRLMFDSFEISKVLVIAPKRVAEDTWTGEAKKWDHLKHLKFALALGSELDRKKALRTKADIYVINRENVAWLVGLYQSAFPFDLVVVDESNSFKSPKSIRFKSLKMVRPLVKRVVILTGTPSPNGLIDLWSQMYLLDMGDRLGKTITSYRNSYFLPGRRNGAVIFDYKPVQDAEKRIYDRIGDICFSMKSEDYISLPARIDEVRQVVLTQKEMLRYEAFEKERVLELVNEGEISAVNAAALSTKLLQYANGAVYDANGEAQEIHDAKLEALEELIEFANGQSVLVFYSYKHDVERIKKRLAYYKPRELKISKDIADWNAGKVQIMLAHPASAGHGLNLQNGGHIVIWFGLNWSLELYMQANARLHRQGQIKPVMIYHLIAKGTIDEDVMRALNGKAEKQEALLEAIKARIKKYTK